MSVIGIDIGGTKINIASISNQGEIFSLKQEKTKEKHLIDQVIEAIKNMKQDLDSPVEAIGVGTAGRVNVKEGSIAFATSNLPNWEGTQVRRILEHHFQIPVAVDNDANCAAYAEKVCGAAFDVDHFLCITIGTGVGAGLMTNGSIIHGENGSTGEVGHMILYPKGKPCNCGKEGCWEQYVSGTALQSAINENEILNSLSLTPEKLFQYGATMNSADELSSKEYLQEVDKIIDDFITDLSYGLQNLQTIFDPTRIILGGGVVESSQYWWERLQEKLANYKVPIHIRKAELQNQAGVIGAGLMAHKLLEMKDRHE